MIKKGKKSFSKVSQKNGGNPMYSLKKRVTRKIKNRHWENNDLYSYLYMVILSFFEFIGYESKRELNKKIKNIYLKNYRVI
uniref:Uncharacterized protein n=1 Tax=viral metagenome TaxID=1070528 RepID=A0A6C0HRP4_9ZZZZ